MNNGYFICFDLDGTLIDSRDDIAAAINHMLTELSLPNIPEKRIGEIVGHGIAATAIKALKEVGATDVDGELAGRLTAEYYENHPVVKTVTYPYVKEGLSILKDRGFGIGLLTNKVQHITELILEQLGIKQYFDIIMGAGDKFPLKPNPEALLHMLKESGVEKEKFFLVGDGSVDLETGKRAGIPTCIVSYGYRPPYALNPDFSADSFKEVSEMFLTMAC